MPVVVVVTLLLAGLTLWLLAGGRSCWWPKLLVISATPAACLGLWAALASERGWPTGDRVPTQALLVGGVVDEGHAIYLWLEPVHPATGAAGLGYHPTVGEPRAYRLPYSRQLHEQLIRALQVAQHHPVGVGIRSRRNGHGRHGNAQRVPRYAIRFYNFPLAHLPPKEDSK